MDFLLSNIHYIGLAVIVKVTISDIVRRVGLLYKRELAGKYALTINGDFSKIEQLIVAQNDSDYKVI